MDNINEVKIYLETMGFKLKDGASELIYQKKYKNHNDYEISVHLNEKNLSFSKINYGNKIKCERATTTGLHQKETFVVLECVNRLIDKGYSPEELILEKDYPSGLKEKGQWLDILVNKDGLPYYMIECKRYGEQYDKAYKDTKTNGGQLLTYYTNDRDVKKVVLYTSMLSNKQIKYKNAIIDTSDFKGSNKTIIFNSDWNKKFDETGLFEENIAPYEIKTVGITKAKLKYIEKDNKLYNGYARILRKYAVSDLTNAYNKLFNLFLCKIVDEDNASDDNNYEMQFQWKHNENAYDVLDKISNLYDEGVKRYLNFNVTDYSKESIENDIKAISDEGTRKSLLLKFHELRFEKNNEFAFIDVFNKETFKENSLILKEVIKLFQSVQIKYSDKQQFLGDFFERLLNIGIKQTEGQFFTPIPIANFIVSSIPFEQIIEKKLIDKDDKFLPYVVDYACGAGHFLTEYMHRIDKLFNTDLKEKCKTKPQKDNYEAWKCNYKWAKEFVYGIEKDYRLTKTSKIACFLNGDGEANILTASGLDSFDSYKYLETKLYENNETYKRDNPVFDCVIANPPYSVQDFKDTLKTPNEESYGDKNFELFESLGDNSDDIECLFMERTKQLIKENGYAAIVISNSFLTNPGIHKKTRELIINNFKIKAIAELGGGAFMATGTNTIVLFMQKRETYELQNVKNFLNGFYSTCKDFNYKEIPNIINHFINKIYLDLSFEDYKSLFNKKPTPSFLKSELFAEYYDEILSNFESTLSKKLNTNKRQELEKNYQKIKKDKSQVDFDELIKIEKEKLELYLINFSLKTVVVKSGTDKDEIANFLGYKFSKRKGDEGLKELNDKDLKELNSYSDRNSIQSKLYNVNKLLDSSKINYYIYKNFMSDLGQSDIEYIEENKLDKNLTYCDLNELIDFTNCKFEKIIKLNSKKKIKIATQYKSEKLAQLLDYFNSGVIYDKKDVSRGKTNNIVLTADSVTSENELEITKKIYLNQTLSLDKNKKLQKNDIFICLSSGSLKHLGKVAYIAEDLNYYAGGFMGILRPNSKIKSKYLFEILKHKAIKNNLEIIATGNNINNLSSAINNIKIPLPPMEIQEKIIEEINEIDKTYIQSKQLLKTLKKEIDQKVNDLYVVYDGKKLGNFCKQPQYGANVKAVNGNSESDYRYIRITDIDNDGNLQDGWKTAQKIEDQYILNDEDFLFARSGATAGKTFYYQEQKHGKAIFAGYLIRFKCENNVLMPKYLDIICKSENYKTWVEDTRGGVAQPNINAQQFSSYKIPMPKIEIQKNIIKEIAPKEQQIEELQKELEEISQQKQVIMDKYLK